jgi:hypothetical protein
LEGGGKNPISGLGEGGRAISTLKGISRVLGAAPGRLFPQWIKIENYGKHFYFKVANK